MNRLPRLQRRVRALADRLAQPSGFTLIELLVAMTIGLVVVSATMTAMIATTRFSRQVDQKVERAQDMRTGMARVVQQLRAINCEPNRNPAITTIPITAASASSITFLADLDNDLTFDPTTHRIRAVDVAGASGLAKLEIAATVAGSLRTVTLADGTLERPTTSQPLFSYRLKGRTTDVARTLTSAELREISAINVRLEIFRRPVSSTDNVRAKRDPSITAVNTVSAQRSAGEQIAGDGDPVFTCVQ